MIDFSPLREWSQLDAQEITSLWSSDNKALLEEYVSLLGSKRLQEVEINKDNFEEVIRAAALLLKKGSQEWSMAIVKGGSLSDQGDVVGAASVYQDFIDGCSSKYYRDLAKTRLKKLNHG